MSRSLFSVIATSAAGGGGAEGVCWQRSSRLLDVVMVGNDYNGVEGGMGCLAAVQAS